MWIRINYFERLIKSYPFHVYVEVSKNHSIPIGEVIRKKFHPEIKALIMYYNYKIMNEQKEYEKIKKENEKLKNNT